MVQGHIMKILEQMILHRDCPLQVSPSPNSSGGIWPLCESFVLWFFLSGFNTIQSNILKDKLTMIPPLFPGSQTTWQKGHSLSGWGTVFLGN